MRLRCLAEESNQETRVKGLIQDLVGETSLRGLVEKVADDSKSFLRSMAKGIAKGQRCLAVGVAEASCAERIRVGGQDAQSILLSFFYFLGLEQKSNSMMSLYMFTFSFRSEGLNLCFVGPTNYYWAFIVVY